MASSAVMTAVRSRITANWTHCPVFYPNESAAAPSDATPFLAVEYPVVYAEQVTVGTPGSAICRESGSIQMTLAAPVGSGVEPYATWIEELRTLFSSVHFGAVKTWEPAPAYEGDKSDDGAYFLFVVDAPYYFDYVA